MSLQCRKCGSRNTEIVSAKKLSDKIGNKSLMTANAGFLVVDPVIIAEALKAIFQVLGKLFDYLKEKEKNKRKIVICKDCGYWERVWLMLKRWYNKYKYRVLNFHFYNMRDGYMQIKIATYLKVSSSNISKIILKSGNSIYGT